MDLFSKVAQVIVEKGGYNHSTNVNANANASNIDNDARNLLTSILHDDALTVLTEFDMDRIASLTFAKQSSSSPSSSFSPPTMPSPSFSSCEDILNVLEETLRQPENYTVTSVHKALVLVRHLSLHGSERAANLIWRHIKPLLAINANANANADPHSTSNTSTSLLEYNTALIMARKYKDPDDIHASLSSIMYRIKGGTVDKGQPVRDEAKKLKELLSNVEEYKRKRTQASHEYERRKQTRLEQRKLEMERIKLQNEVNATSNAPRSNISHDGGFGAGVGVGGTTGNPKGHVVVGAAHSMEDMLKLAMQHKTGYKDGGMSKEDEEHYKYVQSLKEELQVQKMNHQNNNNNGGGGDGGGNGSASSMNNGAVVDLLDFGSGAASGSGSGSGNNGISNHDNNGLDELPYDTTTNEDPYILTPATLNGSGYGGTTRTRTHAENDNNLLFGGGTTSTATTAGIFTTTVDPFGPGPSSPPAMSMSQNLQQQRTQKNDVDLLSMTMMGMSMQGSQTQQPQPHARTTAAAPLLDMNTTTMHNQNSFLNMSASSMSMSMMQNTYISNPNINANASHDIDDIIAPVVDNLVMGGAPVMATDTVKLPHMRQNAFPMDPHDNDHDHDHGSSYGGAGAGASGGGYGYGGTNSNSNVHGGMGDIGGMGGGVGTNNGIGMALSMLPPPSIPPPPLPNQPPPPPPPSQPQPQPGIFGTMYQTDMYYTNQQQSNQSNFNSNSRSGSLYPDDLNPFAS